MVSSWTGKLNWGPCPLEDHIDTCRGCVESHGTPSFDITLSHLVGALNTFNNLFIAPHYMQDDALGLTVPPTSSSVYTGFGSWSKAQRRFVSSLRHGRESIIFRALIWSSLQAYFSTGDPWDTTCAPEPLGAPHDVLHRYQGATPLLIIHGALTLIMAPWGLSDALQGPFYTWFNHFVSLFDGLFFTLWATWQGCH